jgi:hypothetical protein
VRYTRVTASAVKELQAKLPGLTVLFQDSSVRTTKRAVDMGTVTGKGEAAIGKWLTAIGASVNMRDGHAVGLSLASTSIADRELALLKELPQLEELSLRDTGGAATVGLANLANLRTLKKLDLSSTTLADSGLAYVKSLTGLQSLDLSHTARRGQRSGRVVGHDPASRAETEQRAARRCRHDATCAG